ncbi:hypothetical protein POSPLADRAFT_1039482 [Postia placenta MAD-698-R-SB12]|uniref:Uncharacterized protein n=1 Tax=Postia placenta MAD-698-R-SB12 TaxID=670580 RepID=A0A1X6N3S8_9APHY|nr:hypothetical protein POSPLADRAFT_1039482 [Postia placenta MAD-698-R-SB12]OSX63277.1 hypothetical protein POSPLADRAFT_1039482 [Postia placenta MAD-698-R-SB12]
MSLEVYRATPTSMSRKCFSMPTFLPSYLGRNRCLSAEDVYAMLQTLLHDMHIRILLCMTAKPGE